MNGPLKLESWGTLEDGTGPLRRGHRDGCLTACDRFTEGKQFTSVILPTRYGKSHLARFITLAGCFGVETPMGVVQPFASTGLFLTHRGFLSRQIIEPKKWKQFGKLFRIQNMPSISACEINRSPARPQNIGENGESFIVCTIPMLSNNLDVFQDWVETKRRIGRPPIVFADEAQFFGDGDDKKWGPALLALAEAGALVMPMTATPLRADGELIPGFEKFGVVTSSDEVERYEDAGINHPELGVVIDPDTNQPIRWTKKSTLARTTEAAELQAHVVVTRQEAWAHKYLCRIQRRRVTIQMTNGEFLHELPATQQRRELGRVIRDELVIEEFLDKAEEELQQIRKKVLSDAGVIVFVDSTRDDDNHANRVARAIRKRKRSVIVATQETGTQDNIDRFVEDGEGDYLIVKNSAGAGLDCERIKVVVDLSAVRQFASCEQRWNRAGTPTNGKSGRITIATLITPADVFSDEIFDAIYTKQGGESKQSTSEVIAEEFIQAKTEDQQPAAPLFVDSIGEEQYIDTGGNQAEGDEIKRGKAVVEKMGVASGFNLGNITIPEGANIVRLFNLTDEQLGLTEEDEDDSDGGLIETGTKIGALRSANHRQAGHLCRLMFGAIAAESMKLTWRLIYTEANAIIRANPNNRHFINSPTYRATNDIAVIEVVSQAISSLQTKEEERDAQAQ